jgi:iron complex transport system substrate-binding protein
MLRMKKLIFACIAIIGLTACNTNNEKQTEQEIQAKRIVSLNGTITETLFTLGIQDSIVGIDVTSTFPSETEKITNLGHISTIAVETILAVKPSHVLAFSDELKPQLQAQLKKAKIEVVLFERELSLDGSKKTIESIAAWAGKESEGKKMVTEMDADLKSLKSAAQKPKVLFIYARGAGSLMVAGENTQLEKMIELAGGENAVSGFSDFKPLTPEAVVAANPDIILMFESGAQSLNGESGISAVPGVSLTNAGKNKRFVTMEGLLLSGFGPRTGKAISTLNHAFFN